jgi:hypothetical protein
MPFHAVLFIMTPCTFLGWKIGMNGTGRVLKIPTAILVVSMYKSSI